MDKNVGNIDKVLRIVAGAVLIGLTLSWRYRRVGLDRRGASGDRPDGLVPGLHRAGHQDLPDVRQEIKPLAPASFRLGQTWRLRLASPLSPQLSAPGRPACPARR